jgi:tetratricopeptide (TPR) repeat protein
MRFVRRSGFFLALIFFLSHGWAQTAAQIAAIRAALSAKEFSQALELVRPVLQEFPGNPELWAMQATAYAGNNDTKNGLASFQTALQLAPDYVPALRGAVQIEFDAADPAAIPLLRRLLRLSPEDPIAHGMLAILEYQQGNCAAAAGHFAKSEAVFDTKLQALHAYATCLVRLKQSEKAIGILRRAVALDSSDPRERQLLASVQLMAHHPSEALVSLNPLLQDRVPDAQTLELASAAYEDARQSDSAVDALRQGIVAHPEDVQLYVDFAALASAHHAFEIGISVVNDGIKLQPKAAPLYFARGVLYVELDQYEKAQADFESAYSLDPTQSLSTAAQALAAIQQNDLDHALASVQQKLAQRPNDPILLYVQADLLIEKGADQGSIEFQTAMRSAKRAVALNPNLAPARAVLGKLYLQSGKYQEATEQCRRALEIDPTDQASLYHLIQALRKTEQKKEIPQLLQRFASLRQQATQHAREQLPAQLVEGETQSR